MVQALVGDRVAVVVVVETKMGPAMKMKFFVAVAASALIASGAGAETLKLDGYTSGLGTVTVTASPTPLPGTPQSAGASGLNFSDTSGGLDPFVAWCLDIGHQLISPGATQDYELTNDPFSNSFGLSADARNRVQALFDANYGTLDTSNKDEAAGFQMALWESAFEADGGAMDLGADVFQASSASNANSFASTYLANAAGFTEPSRYRMSFYQVSGLDGDREYKSGQNIVTVSEVPLPAAGLLLLTALGGTAFVGRRRRKS